MSVPPPSGHKQLDRQALQQERLGGPFAGEVKTKKPTEQKATLVFDQSVKKNRP